jgi:hypothetical protein
MSTPSQPGQTVLAGHEVAALLQDTTPWLSCDDCFERMDTYAEATISDPGRPDEAMATHLRGCAACNEEAQSLIALLRGR